MCVCGYLSLALYLLNTKSQLLIAKDNEKNILLVFFFGLP